MTRLFSGLVLALFPALAGGLLLILPGAALLFGLASGQMLLGAVLAVAAVLAALMLLGLVALQIETYRSVQRGVGPEVAPEAEPEAEPVAEPLAGRLAGRMTAQGRRAEPVVTLRRHPVYDPV